MVPGTAFKIKYKMNYLKQTLFTGWNFMRWVRLVLGGVFAYQAVIMHDSLYGLFAGLFLFQAFFNVGCCGSQGCASPYSSCKAPVKNGSADMEEVKD